MLLTALIRKAPKRRFSIVYIYRSALQLKLVWNLLSIWPSYFKCNIVTCWNRVSLSPWILQDESYDSDFAFDSIFERIRYFKVFLVFLNILGGMKIDKFLPASKFCQSRSGVSAFARACLISLSPKFWWAFSPVHTTYYAACVRWPFVKRYFFRSKQTVKLARSIVCILMGNTSW